MNICQVIQWQRWDILSVIGYVVDDVWEIDRMKCQSGDIEQCVGGYCFRKHDCRRYGSATCVRVVLCWDHGAVTVNRRACRDPQMTNRVKDVGLSWSKEWHGSEYQPHSRPIRNNFLPYPYHASPYTCLPSPSPRLNSSSQARKSNQLILKMWPNSEFHMSCYRRGIVGDTHGNWH